MVAGLVAAAAPYSLGGKAATARAYGIAIVAQAAFQRLPNLASSRQRHRVPQPDLAGWRPRCWLGRADRGNGLASPDCRNRDESTRGELGRHPSFVGLALTKPMMFRPAVAATRAPACWTGYRRPTLTLSGSNIDAASWLGHSRLHETGEDR